MYYITCSPLHPTRQGALAHRTGKKTELQPAKLFSLWPWGGGFYLPWLNPRWLGLQHGEIYLSQKSCFDLLVRSRNVSLSYKGPGQVELKSIIFLVGKTNCHLRLWPFLFSAFVIFLTWELNFFILGRPTWVAPFSYVDLKQMSIHYSENITGRFGAWRKLELCRWIEVIITSPKLVIVQNRKVPGQNVGQICITPL